MAKEIHKAKPYCFNDRTESSIYMTGDFAPPFMNYPSHKRRILNRG